MMMRTWVSELACLWPLWCVLFSKGCESLLVRKLPARHNERRKLISEGIEPPPKERWAIS